MITIFKNIFSKEPHYISIDTALERIKVGKSKTMVDELRNTIDKERRNKLKLNLPSICFSGKFGKDRLDSQLEEHSGFLVLDFDDIDHIEELKKSLMEKEYVYASWISPSGNGVKALVKIAEPKKHREHFQSLQEVFTEIDKSGINVSRVCYESFDPNILINTNAKPYTKYKVIEKHLETVRVENDIFDKILKWLSNKGDAFISGERNTFIFKLASACCRFGIQERECEQSIQYSILGNDNSFTLSEAIRTIRSAYRANKGLFGSVHFEKEVLVDRTTRKEVVIDDSIYDLEVRPKDVIFGEDVKQDALNIFDSGYESANSTYITELDTHFKWKRGEMTLLSGIGNYGKSTFLRYLILLQVIRAGRKFALYVPEDCPAHEFYHDLVEMYCGMNCTPYSKQRPTRENYEAIYDYIAKSIFFVYPKDISPTPEYIKERFLELIIKEKVDGCVIDPFNQMTNDYSSVGGRDDKYLEVVLSDFTRFAQNNQVYFVIVAHPKGGLKKDAKGNYECPDVFDLAGGAMWNNKMDNILIYHRPHRGEDPNIPTCTLEIKKIRRQKIVGILGSISFKLSPRSRRYLFNEVDYLAQSLLEEQQPTNDFAL